MSRIQTTSGLLGYATVPVFRRLRNWWLHRAEQHYMICAEVETARAREANINAAYFQKRAMLARLARV